MKIKMKGSELKKVDIEFLSLVKRGANRAPFKVVKAEDQVAASLTQKTGLVGAVQKFFQLSEPSPSVVAVFVEKSALDRTLPNLADAGFKLDKHELMDDCVVFKQDGFDAAEEVIMLKSEKTVGFAIANVTKFADLFCGDLAFDPSVADSGFYPGLNAAMGALQATMGEHLAKGESSDAENMIAAYQNYSKQVVKALPSELWKFESLQRGFGSDTTDMNVTGEVVVKTPTEVAKAAAALAQTLTKAFNGGKKGGVQQQAQDQTMSSSEGSDQNSSTSELAGSSDDSPDDNAQRSAQMAKGATDTTSSETVGEDAARKANGTDTSGTTSEEDKMSKAAKTIKDGLDEGDSAPKVTKSYRPKLFKEADGTEYVQAIDHKTGMIEKYQPGAKIPEGKTTMTEEWEQHGSNGNFGNEDGQGKGKAYASESADYELSHTGAGGMKKSEIEAILKSLSTLPELVINLAKTVEKQGEELKKTQEKLTAVEKTATTAVSKADRTVVHVSPVHDAAYENLGGGQRQTRVTSNRTAAQVAKAEYPDDVWKGALGAIEQHRRGIEEV